MPKYKVTITEAYDISGIVDATDETEAINVFRYNLADLSLIPNCTIEGINRIESEFNGEATEEFENRDIAQEEP